MDSKDYYLAWAGTIAAVPLSGIGFAELLPASVSAGTAASLGFFWFMFCVWSVSWTFMEYGPRYEARKRAARESYLSDEGNG
jgi:hypothetical protein